MTTTSSLSDVRRKAKAHANATPVKLKFRKEVDKFTDMSICRLFSYICLQLVSSLHRYAFTFMLNYKSVNVIRQLSWPSSVWCSNEIIYVFPDRYFISGTNMTSDLLYCHETNDKWLKHPHKQIYYKSSSGNESNATTEKSIGGGPKSMVEDYQRRLTSQSSLTNPLDVEQIFTDMKDTELSLTKLRKVPSTKKKLIKKSGGIIELHGCSLTFPKDALSDDTEITMTLNTNSEEYPKTGTAITPILGVEPSMSFRRPVTVRMETCFAADNGNKISVSLMTRTCGSDWEIVRDVDLLSEYYITFEVKHFSDETVEMNLQHKNNGQFRIKNEVFIRQGVGMITSYFYLFEKDEKDVLKAMRSRSCASFGTGPLLLSGAAEDEVKFDIFIYDPNSSSTTTHKINEWFPKKNLTFQEVYKYGSDHFDAILLVGHFDFEAARSIHGLYRVFIGENREPDYTALLAREWPIQLDPEIRDSTRSITAGNLAIGGASIHENNQHCTSAIMRSDRSCT